METERQLYDTLMDGKLPVVQRVRRAVREWCKHHFVLVLDNFEAALDLETRSISDPDLRSIYEILARDLTAGSRVLVTCRYQPKETPLDQPQVLVLPLNDIQDADFRKYLRQDEKIEAHLREGRLTEPLLQALFRTFGGTPGCWFQLRPLLQNADLDAWEGELPAETVLEEKRQEYCEKLLLPKLYDLQPELTRQLVSRIAISELPIPVAALAGLFDVDEAKASTAIDCALAYGLAQKFSADGKPDLYHVPGLIRDWLMASERLTSAKALAAHTELAKFWRSAFENERKGDLRVSPMGEVFFCHHHARIACDLENWICSAVILSRYFLRISDWRQARLFLNAIPAASRDSSVWFELGSLDLHEGRYAAARKNFAISLALDEKSGDRLGVSSALHQLASIFLSEGNLAMAKANFDKALEIDMEIGNRAGIAAVLHNLATIDLNEKKYDEARDKFGKSQEIKEEIGDLVAVATTWHQLAVIDDEQGDYAGARDKSAKALNLRDAAGDHAGVATTLHLLAGIDLKEGNFADARRLFDTALRMRQQIGDRPGEAASLHGLASVDLEEGDYAAAGHKFANALKMNQEMGARVGEAATWHQLGLIAWRIGKKLVAIRLFAVSTGISSKLGTGNLKPAQDNLIAAMEELSCTEEQARELMQSAADSYGSDAGATLLREVLGADAGPAASESPLPFPC